MKQGTSTEQAVKPGPGRWAGLGKAAGAGMVWLALGVLTLWVVAALYYDVRISWLRRPLALLYGLGALAVFVMLKPRFRSMGIVLGGFFLVLGWWLSLRPSNERDWLPDLAVLPYADIEGDRVTIHHIRNCDYRTETDFEVRHYDRTFELSRLRTLDLYFVYWGSPLIAHTMATFGFEGGEYLCFSIEVRKEKGEGYSAVKGFFRQFELTYVIADERDLVRLRTNYRKGEDVYLYRLKMRPEQIRERLLEYLNRANRLYSQPQWYNALTDNCTTSVRTQRAASQRAPWDWRILANGKADELLYERGVLDLTLPFAELKKLSLINARGQAAGQGADFSERIRKGLPGFGGE